ncbi:FHA domain-containing protein [Ructibacterium gallinarum]|uniref:VWA domain-containing protein n=1 Tax=Ructibacterium gallinarum TaxID=2779355 RepID=A0A9D5M2K5_9FIRM|nr:FHA domain-containing protein [Ructibacterium gallinarum]MBE5040328.1 VWA domain-containing protein [Ructibacterium gallinarum]
MAKRLICIYILFSLLCIPIGITGAGISSVNIRQFYLYTDALHTYVDLKSADGVSVSGLDRSGIYASLDSEDLRVKEIQTFAESGEGMAYIFLIDISGSLSGTQFSQVKAATKHWAEKMDEKDRMAIISFGNEAKIVQDFTQDAGQISTVLDSLSNSDGNTKLYGGIEEAINLAGRNDAGLPKRKAVLLLTDGLNDYPGGISQEDVIIHAKEDLIPFYTLLVPRGNTAGKAFLNTLSETTNGTAYDLSTGIDTIYDAAYAELQEAFVIDFSYPAAKADGQLHNLKISVRLENQEASDDISCTLKNPTETLASLPISASGAGGETEKEHKNMSPILLIAIIITILLVFAAIILVIALVNRKKKELPTSSFSSQTPVYTPESANIPISAPTPKTFSTGSMAFSLHEIGGTDVKESQIADTLILGRGADCGLVLSDPQISSRHCRLTRENGILFIEDLNSTNGTIINGMTITGKTRLKNGDLLLLGGTEYRIRFEEK